MYDLDLLPMKQIERVELDELLESANKIGQKFFPDELARPCATISLESGSNDTKLILVYPTNPSEHSFPWGLKMTCFMDPDLKTRTFKLPYTGKRNV
jgi:hypothetical protein